MRSEVFFDEDTTKDRRVTGETYLAQFNRTGIRITLRSGPRGAYNAVGLTQTEFDELITAYLRFVRASAPVR